MRKQKRGCFNCRFQDSKEWKCTRLGDGYGILSDARLKDPIGKIIGQTCTSWEQGKDLLYPENNRERIVFT